MVAQELPTRSLLHQDHCDCVYVVVDCVCFVFVCEKKGYANNLGNVCEYPLFIKKLLIYSESKMNE